MSDLPEFREKRESLSVGIYYTPSTGVTPKADWAALLKAGLQNKNGVGLGSG